MVNARTPATRLGRRLNSFRCAGRGAWQGLAHQANGRVHLLLATAVIALSFGFGLGATEWCLVACAIGAVTAAEVFNSAIEQLADALCPQFHPAIGRAKDLAAGAVLLTAAGAAVVGFLIFLPRVLALGT